MVPSASDENIPQGEASRTAILEWCLTNQFELIETDIEEDEEELDDFSDKEGKARIASALKAHTWSNLELLEDISGRGRLQAEDSPSLETNQEENEEFQATNYFNIQNTIIILSLFCRLTVMVTRTSTLKICSLS